MTDKMIDILVQSGSVFHIYWIADQMLGIIVHVWYHNNNSFFACLKKLLVAAGKVLIGLLFLGNCVEFGFGVNFVCTGNSVF